MFIHFANIKWSGGETEQEIGTETVEEKYKEKRRNVC